AVAFEGSGCSISQASASMMTEAVSGQSVDDALGLADEFRSFMEGAVEPDEEAFGDLVALKGVVKYAVRIKCAVLAWDVLQDAMAGAGDASVAGAQFGEGPGAPSLGQRTLGGPETADQLERDHPGDRRVRPEQ